jgi:two-component system CheB/CheR fusion protein
VLRYEADVSRHEQRLESLFAIKTVGMLFWDSNFRLSEVNDAFLMMTGFSRAEALGKTWQELTPVEFYATSERAVAEIDTCGESTPSEKQYYRKDGSRWWGLFAARRVGDEVAEFVLDVTARKSAEYALRESDARFREFGDASSDILWICNIRTMQFEYVSAAFDAVYGEAVAGVFAENGFKRWLKRIVPEDRRRVFAAFRRVRAGERVTHEFRIMPPSADRPRWIRDTDFPLRGHDGRVDRIGGIARDVTEEKASSDRLQVMVAELQHRTRNLVAVIRSLAHKTLRESTSLEDFRDNYCDRLDAVARAQGLLSRLADGEKVTFDGLLAAELSIVGGRDNSRITLEGPSDIRLRSSTVQTFALALHELATNAVKYGALATPTGRLHVRWAVDAVVPGREQTLHVVWRESGVAVPADPPPPSGGYGRELIEHALPYQLNAKTTYALSPDGVRCTITVPLSTVH